LPLLRSSFWAAWAKVSNTRYHNSPEGKAEIARQEAASQAAGERLADEMLGEVDLDIVRGKLRDPASAQFYGVRSLRAEGKRITCGNVNARNGLGGMAGASAFAVVNFVAYLSDHGRDARSVIRKACG
jgi:hypothetical protein